jgi:hypothetical protein
MTFEEAYGRWLVEEINAQTTSKFKLKCRQYSELASKPLAKNPDEIAIVISGGGASRSAVEGRDQNNGNFSVLVLCQKKHMENVQAAISAVQKEYNAVAMEMAYINASGRTATVLAKSVFFTPIVIDSQDYQTDDYGTLKAVFIQFSVTVLYGEDLAVVVPEEFKLGITIGSTAIYTKIVNILSYDRASIPSYDSYLAQGNDRNEQQAISKNNSWSFTIYKQNKSTGLQAILEDELDSASNEGLAGRSLALRITKNGEDIDIPIKTYQLTESYVDNAAVYILTLTA